MEMMIKKGKTIEHYKSSGAIGQGEGAKAGTAYRMKDGLSFIFRKTNNKTNRYPQRNQKSHYFNNKWSIALWH
jgi:hypothetical protein